MRYLTLLFMTLCCWALALPAQAVDDFYGPEGGAGALSNGRVPLQSGPSGGSDWEASFVEDVELGPLMGRLYEVLTREDMVGQIPEARAVGELLKGLGLMNIGRDHTEYQISGDTIRCASWTEFDDPEQATFFGKLTNLPDAEIKSARYLGDDQLLYLALGNVTDKAMLGMESMLSLAAEAEANGGVGPLSEMFGADSDVSPAQALAMIKATKLDMILKETLTGEIALAVYNLPAAANIMTGAIAPSDIDAAVFIGLSGDASLTELLEAFGPQIGLSEIESPIEGWRCLQLAEPAGIGILANGDFMIATTDLARMAPRLASAGTRTITGQLYFDLNFQRLHDELLAPALKMAVPADDKRLELTTKSAAYLLGLPESAALGHIRLATHHQDSGLAWELTLPKAIPLYVGYYAGSYAPLMH